MEDFMLLHYKNKLLEISEDISSIEDKLKLAREIVDESWDGRSGDACDEKIEYTTNELNKANNDINDAIAMLGTIDLTSVE